MEQFFAFTTLSLPDLAMRFAVATVLPLLVGLERYYRSKPIDFRPYVIISVVACGIIMSTTELMETIDVDVDPTRIMQGVITGIGFLGAGAMFKEGDFIKGAGSAASIWSAGVIGLVCGLGQMGLAVVMTTIVLTVMLLSEPFIGDWDN